MRVMERPQLRQLLHGRRGRLSNSAVRRSRSEFWIALSLLGESENLLSNLLKKVVASRQFSVSVLPTLVILSAGDTGVSLFPFALSLEKLPALLNFRSFCPPVLFVSESGSGASMLFRESAKILTVV